MLQHVLHKRVQALIWQLLTLQAASHWILLVLMLQHSGSRDSAKIIAVLVPSLWLPKVTHLLMSNKCHCFACAVTYGGYVISLYKTELLADTEYNCPTFMSSRQFECGDSVTCISHLIST